jgi:hypothetical protein
MTKVEQNLGRRRGFLQNPREGEILREVAFEVDVQELVG